MTTSPPDFLTLPALVDWVAASRSNETYLIDAVDDEAVPYADLRLKLAGVARTLVGCGAGCGDAVAVLSENTPAAAILILGTMYGGFVSVPLSATAGRRALIRALDHCGARILFASERYLQLAEDVASKVEHSVEVYSTDRVGTGAEPAFGATAAIASVRATDPALLIYTSGTTARPKGVSFAHGNLMACAANSARAHRLDADDRLLCVLPIYHMSSMVRLLAALWSGGGLVLARRFDAAAYWQLVDRHRCTWLAINPTVVERLLAIGRPPDALLPRGIRFARCSSAPLRPARLRRFEETFGVALVEGMGMTEAGDVFLNPVPPGRRKRASVGIPLGIQARVVDGLGSDIEPGQTGDIVVRGPSVMTGYHRDEVATAEVLDDESWLRTGDQGYCDEEGYFFLSGRTKEIVIKAGVNIAPLEVEEALEAHPSVAQAAVVGAPEDYLGEQIVAFVVLEEALGSAEGELRQWTESLLGPLKTPDKVAVVDALPRGTTGKVLRGRLRQLVGEVVRSSEGERPAVVDAAQCRRVAQVLASKWADALGLDVVQEDEDFFDLGGDSLLALQMVLEVQREFSIVMPLSLFVEAPTISEQAPLVAALTARPTGGADLSIESRRSLEPSAQPNPPPLLAPVRSGATRPPLFCAYGLNKYRDLARELGPLQPTYGLFAEQELQALSLQSYSSGVAPMFPLVQDLASVYLAQIRSIQPTGPYHLIGYSFGGRVALEVAHQLRSAGETVALLAAIDTFLDPREDKLHAQWLLHHARMILRDGPSHLARALVGRIGPLLVRLSADVRVPIASPVLSPSHLEAELRRRARSQHRPPTYRGPIVLFRAAHRSPAYRVDPLLGWGSIARGGLETHDIAGTHESILREPGVKTIAEKLQPYLG